MVGEKTAMSSSARDGQLRSAFTEILERLVCSCSDGLAAVLVDREGESVDYAARYHAGGQGQPGSGAGLTAYNIKLAAAYWQIVMRELTECRNIGVSPLLTVQAGSYGYVVQQLWEGYVLMLVCRPSASFTVSARALRQAEVELSREASLPVPNADAPVWWRVRVRLGPGGKPQALHVGGRWRTDIRVLAPAEGLGSFERGFRIALRQGEELTLVREPSACWYASGPLLCSG